MKKKIGSKKLISPKSRVYRKLCQTNRGYSYLTYKPRKGDVCTQNIFYRSCDFENGPRELHCRNILYIAETTENRSVSVVLTFRSTVENHCPSARSYLVKQYAYHCKRRTIRKLMRRRAKYKKIAQEKIK